MARQDIAIVGMGCHLPGDVHDPESYWRFLLDERSAIREVPADRWNWQKFYHPDPDVPGRMVSRWGGFVEDLEQFDPVLYGISPREARYIDPQQRVLLETTWRALEDAGIAPESLAGEPVGVFVGISISEMSDRTHNDLDAINIHSGTGGAISIAANRVSFTFDFKGPSIAIDTACSSALVAVSLAYRELTEGRCHTALAGGVNALLSPRISQTFSKSNMLSPDGQCFTFDARANGYVRGEGGGMVVLKLLDKAIEDGDRIYAVIKAVSVNQDGHTPSLTVPDPDAQAAMLRTAYKDAGIDPARVAYVEAHGTGTPLGDPIEAGSIGQVLGVGRSADSPLLIGSVKTNIGHLEPASGVASLIKAALILHHGIVPAQLNFEQGNPAIPFEDLHLEVVSKARSLPRIDDTPLTVGVNSFGFGGTNAHVVLGEAPQIKTRQSIPREAAGRPYLLPISGMDAESLGQAAGRWAGYLAESADSLADITTGAGLRRGHLYQRVVVTGQNMNDIRGHLQELARDPEAAASNSQVVTGSPSAELTAPVFVYTGQGAQYPQMGQALRDRESVAREALAEIDELFGALSGWSLLAEMGRPPDDSRIHDTDVTQPAIFAVQVALTELWKSWGIHPSRTLGHSVGELAAAYAAGIYTLEDAVRIIYHRSQLQHRTLHKGGGMAAVGLPLGDLLTRIKGHPVQVAAINSPGMVTLAGDESAVRALTDELEAEGTFARTLKIQYAFHSTFMDSIHNDLIDALADITSRDGHIPFISTVTTEPMPGHQVDAAYWWRNVREPVGFAASVTGLLEAGDRTFLEVGPHPALAGSITACMAEAGIKGAVFTSLRRKSDDSQEMAASLARMHIAGLPLDWATINGGRTSHIDLPAYPMQLDRYRIVSESYQQDKINPEVHPLLGTRLVGPLPTWTVSLDTRVLPYLADHRIWDGVILPAAGFMEMALAVARDQFPNENYAVEDLRIEKALIIAESAPPEARVTFTPDTREVRVYSRTDRDAEWVHHASASLRLADADPPQQVDLPALRADLPDHRDHVGFYRVLDEQDYPFGPEFRQIQNVQTGAGQAVARVEATPLVRRAVDEYTFHPSLLDACLQTFSALIGPEHPAYGQSLPYLPSGVDRLQVFVPHLPDRFYACTRLADDNLYQLVMDVIVCDEDGIPLAELHGVRFDYLGAPSPLSGEDYGRVYQFQWIAKPLPETEPGESSASTMLVFADDGGVCERLVAQFESDGMRVQMVRPDEIGSDGIVTLITEADQPDAPLTQIIYGWPLNLTAANALTSDAGVMGAFRLARALAERPPVNGASVLVLTRDTFGVMPGDALDGLAASTLTGLLRVVNNEHPACGWRQVDLDPHADSNEITRLVDELSAPPGETEVAYRGGVRYVHRLTSTSWEALPEKVEQVTTPGDVYDLTMSRAGRLGNLNLARSTRYAPGPGEVEVGVRAAGLNFRDVMKALGLYPGHSEDQQRLGDDIAGEVLRVGAGVTDYQPGDTVLGFAPYGFSSHAVLDARLLMRKPTAVDFHGAATIPTAFLTAYYALVELARMQPGERVLIHAGAGGVGQAAIQIAKDLGVEIFSTAGAQEKRDFLRAQGVDHVLYSRSLDFAGEIMANTGGQGVDAVLNSLAGDYIPRSLSVLAPFGRYLEIGKVDVYGNRKLGMASFRNNLSMHIIDLMQVVTYRPEKIAEMLRALEVKFETGTYRPLPVTTFPVEQAEDAFRYMANAKHTGKIVLDFPAEVSAGPRMTGPHRFSEDGFYLIVGGTSGFGLEVARWLADQGAKHLVLMSRGGQVDDQGQALIDELTGKGVQVRIRAGDVTLYDDVEAVIDEIAAENIPLTGVIHSAMLLHDGLIREQGDHGKWGAALWVKALGAWNLHRATADIPLKHFICFSSIASVVGSVAQSNYAAGNAFLDALAEYRSARGLPALTVNFGPLGGAGYLTRDTQNAAFLRAMGMGQVPLEVSLAALGTLMRLDTPNAGVFSANWHTVSNALPALATSKVYEALLEGGAQGSADDALLGQIAGADEAARPALLLAYLQIMMSEVLGIEAARIDADVTLAALGLDSLMSVELVNRVNGQVSRYDLSLAITEVLGVSSIGSLADLLAKKFAARGEGAIQTDTGSASVEAGLLAAFDTEREDGLDLYAEAVLDDDIMPAEGMTAPSGPVRHILMTGASGFLGAFLLRDLLDQTEAQITCLVRAGSSTHAMTRLLENLASYDLPANDVTGRVKALSGDLTAPLLGLDPDTYAGLAASVDTVLHNASSVNLGLPYRALKPVNVGGVERILRFVVEARLKTVHYVSTIMVFYQQRHDDSVIPEDTWAESPEVPSGYRRSKWVAERLIRQALERGIPAAVYRPGIIVGHSVTGVTNMQDLASRVARGTYQLGIYADNDAAWNLIPVDYVSRGIVHLMQRAGSVGHIYHLTHPDNTPQRDWIEWLKALRPDLQKVSPLDWRMALVQQARSGIDNAMIPLLPMFLNLADDEVAPLAESGRTRALLAKAGIECPPITRRMSEVYFAYLNLTGEDHPIKEGI